METQCQREKSADKAPQEKLGFFQKMFHKLDEKMKAKADAAEPCCCCDDKKPSSGASDKCC